MSRKEGGGEEEEREDRGSQGDLGRERSIPVGINTGLYRSIICRFFFCEYVLFERQMAV